MSDLFKLSVVKFMSSFKNCKLSEHFHFDNDFCKIASIRNYQEND